MEKGRQVDDFAPKHNSTALLLCLLLDVRVPTPKCLCEDVVGHHTCPVKGARSLVVLGRRFYTKWITLSRTMVVCSIRPRCAHSHGPRVQCGLSALRHKGQEFNEAPVRSRAQGLGFQ